jgi:hypothetical protein
MQKKILAFIPVILVWLLIGSYVFKPTITDRYFVQPYGVLKHTDSNNGVSGKNMLLRIPVRIAGHRFSVPAPYTSRVGPWHPDGGYYSGMLHVAASGKDYSPLPGAVADSELHALSIWVDERPAPPKPTELIRNPPKPKELPATVAAFVAGVEKDPNYWLRGGMVRAADLDKFGLTAYRDHFWGETYVGARPQGGVMVFHCKGPEEKIDPICEVFDAQYPEHAVLVKYAYPKRYIAQWREFDTGVLVLLKSFARS